MSPIPARPRIEVVRLATFVLALVATGACRDHDELPTSPRPAQSPPLGAVVATISFGGYDDIGNFGGNAGAAIIGDNGDVTGRLETPGGLHLVRWTPSTGLQDLGTPLDCSSAVASDINASGMIVGSASGCGSAGQEQYAFRWSASSGFTVLRQPSSLWAHSTGAAAINTAGFVAGAAVVPGGAYNIAVWSPDGTITVIAPPSVHTVQSVVDINDGGTVVGQVRSQVTGFSQAFVWQPGGSLQLIQAPGGGSITPTDIGEDGTVVGHFVAPSSDNRHAFVWKNGSLQELTPGELSEAVGVTDAGEVFGNTLQNPGSYPFRWSAASGLQSLATNWPANVGRPLVTAVSATGIATGRGVLDASGVLKMNAFRWNAADGFEDLGPGVGYTSTGTSVNRHGQVAGFVQVTTQTNRWARWTAAVEPPADDPLPVLPSVGNWGLHSCALLQDAALRCWGLNSDGAATPPADLGPVAQLAVGGLHTCALETDRDVRCWGHSGWNQLSVPAGLEAIQLSAGGTMSCALKPDRSISCWGDGRDSQLEPPASAAPALEVSAGGDAFGCALRENGTVVCWGFSGDGRTAVPAGLTSVVQINAGAKYACARRSDGTVVCWGPNDFGRATVPAGLTDAIQVNAGSDHTCAVRANRTVTCWGRNDIGQATPPAGLTSVAWIEAGDQTTCALRTDDTVVCWGANNFGQTTVPSALRPAPLPQVVAFSSTPASPALIGTSYTVTATGGGSGNPVTLSSLTPNVCSVSGNVASMIAVGTCTIAADQAASLLYAAAPQTTQSFPVTALTPGAYVSAGAYHSCVLSASGTAQCWGNNDEGRATPPADVGTIARLRADHLHTCALRTDGTVRCWGRDHEGSLVPPADLVASQISLGGTMTCALRFAQTGVCWGSTRDGQLDVPNDQPILQLEGGGDAMACALRAGGSVICWGFSGDNRTTVPAGLSGVTQISVGTQHACALRSDGTVACWGLNPDGRASPPPALAGVTQISAGHAHSCALKTDKTVVCWGLTTQGQVTIPVGLTNVAQVDAGAYHTCARRTDETIVCWGDNTNGQSNVPANLKPEPLPQAITFTSTPVDPRYGATYTLTATGGGSGAPVTFASLTPSVCTIAGTTATFVGVGTCTITANQAAAGLYAAAPQVTQTFAVAKANQLVQITSTPTNTFPTGTMVLQATAGGSGNPVTFGALSLDVCTVSGDVVQFVAEGTCRVAADQAGSAFYNPAPQALLSILVARLPQTIAFTNAPPSPALLDGSYTVAATATSGLPVQFAAVGSACTVTTSIVRFVDVGSCELRATQTGNQKYLPAPEARLTFSIIYPFTGFIQPTANLPTPNVAKAGADIRLKFSLGGDRGLDVIHLVMSGPVSSCSTTALPSTMVSHAPTSVKYDATAGQYIFTWTTSATWANTCRQLIITLKDRTEHRVNFSFRK